MELYTIQLAQWRKARDRGIPLHDSTVKSGGTSPFIPDPSSVLAYKAGEISEEIYTRRYQTRMRHSYQQRTQEWLDILQQPTLAIACYCPAGCFCHRLLLADLLRRVAAFHQISFTYGGEIS